MALINGVEYGWCDIQVMLLGRRLEGITEVSYETKKAKKNVYGRGTKVISRGRGNEEPTASITLTGKEMDALERALPKGKKITDISPFKIVVAYAPEDGSNLVRKDELLDCEFTNQPKGAKQGDENTEHQLELIVGDILYNA
jgi:hypothetical protein